MMQGLDPIAIGWKILICDEIHQRLMTDLYFQHVIDYKPGISYHEVSGIIHEYDALIIRTGIHVDQSLIQKAVKLKIIARAGAGLDNIDVSIAELHGIVCINCPEANRDAVAEQAIGMLLGLSSKIVKSDREVRNHHWDRSGNRGIEIGGKTIGIVGYGNTGSSFAKKLRGFDCRIVAYDKYLTAFGNTYVEECQMQILFDEADIVSFHIPLTDETLRLIDDAYLRNFRRPIVLLNLSRGKIMVLSDVLKALDAGRILGFATDVLENEELTNLTVSQKREFESLVERDNVIITPHIGGWSIESYEKISIVLAKKMNAAYESLAKKGNVLLKE